MIIRRRISCGRPPASWTPRPASGPAPPRSTSASPPPGCCTEMAGRKGKVETAAVMHSVWLIMNTSNRDPISGAGG